MIAFLKAGHDGGHFVVLEPVGVLGKSVMILDFPRPNQIMGYTDLIRSSKWTGLVLVPVTTWERFGPWVLSGLGAVLVGLGAMPRWWRLGRGRRSITTGLA